MKAAGVLAILMTQGGEDIAKRLIWEEDDRQALIHPLQESINHRVDFIQQQ